MNKGNTYTSKIRFVYVDNKFPYGLKMTWYHYTICNQVILLCKNNCKQELINSMILEWIFRFLQIKPLAKE